MLGTGEQRVFVTLRGGSPTLIELPWASLQWGRRLDGASDATTGMGASAWDDAACCRVLSDLNPWEHELSVWWGDTLAWAGPVMTPSYEDESAGIRASDLTFWFDRRNIDSDQNYSDDLADIFAGIANATLAIDNPGITVSPSPTGIVGDRTYLASKRQRVADALRELARSGVDFTAIGRNVLVGGTEVSVPSLRLGGSQLVGAKLERRGEQAASEVTVVGADASIFAIAGGISGAIGLVALTSSEPDILDIASVQAAADSRLAFLDQSPTYLTATIAADTPIDMADLIPGAIVDARRQVGCVDASGLYRLMTVDVDQRAGEIASVTVQLSPVGTE